MKSHGPTDILSARVEDNGYRILHVNLAPDGADFLVQRSLAGEEEIETQEKAQSQGKCEDRQNHEQRKRKMELIPPIDLPDAAEHAIPRALLARKGTEVGEGTQRGDEQCDRQEQAERQDHAAQLTRELQKGSEMPAPAVSKAEEQPDQSQGEAEQEQLEVRVSRVAPHAVVMMPAQVRA